jgi:glucosamine--fructose-6-phosphate aminotransferase (isomerizing)
METKGQHTFNEIMSQPTVWAKVIKSFYPTQETILGTWNELRPENVLFIGCGSTFYLSQVAASLFQSLTGVPAKACPSSELLLFPSMALTRPGHTLLVAISRSGTTTETLEAVNQFRNMGGLSVWAISCYPESALAQSGDLTLLASAAQEQSVAQTRSFSSMLVLAQALAAAIAGKDTTPLSALPGSLDSLLGSNADLLETLGKRIDFKRIFFLGSGYQYGIANEAMLKMKEMSLTNSEAFHFMEFRHGPMSMATEKALIAGLFSESARGYEEKVLSEMKALGAHTIGLNAVPDSDYEFNVFFDNGSLPAWTMPALYLPPLQLLAYHRSISKGLDPDNPRNLEAVISLDPAAFASA